MSAREAKRRLGAPDYVVTRIAQGRPDQYLGIVPHEPTAEQLLQWFGEGVYFVREYAQRIGYQVHVSGGAKP